jgi:hypothetical protein
MQHRARYFALGVLLMVGLSGCPVTDDYYLLSADEPNGKAGQTGGDGNKAGSSSEAGSSSGSSTQGGQAPQAGTGGGVTAGTASGGDTAIPVGGAGDTGGAPDGGQAGQAPVAGEAGAGGAMPDPCVPTTERCNGHDDDCDDVVDELAACLSNCSGFVLTSDSSHGYMFCTAARKANWTDAKKSCEDQDMRLAWLESDLENDAVAQKLADLGSDVEILFGATDQGNEGDWLWVGGEQFWEGDEDGNAVAGRYNNWGGGTPNNTSNEDCALMNAMTGAWGDRTCNALYPYVCEQPD